MAEGKTHGIIEAVLPPINDYDLLIIPDASSSETKKHKKLYEQGKEILILDHHECEDTTEEYAVIINPHHPKCTYPNKDLSGVGVVYKFIEAIDKLIGVDNHTQFLDLVATGMVADVMSVRSMENKALINMGLNNIVNPYIKAYLKADGRVKGKPFTPNVISFYLAPQINALIRMGTLEEKLELCAAMIGAIDAEFVVAKIISIKGKQDRKKDPVFTRIVMDMQKVDRDKNKVLIGELPKHTPTSLTGLIAGQMAGAYEKPTLLGRHLDDGSFSGSIRSISGSSIENFKDFCEESGLFNWVAGHQAACGFSLPAENIDKFITYSEQYLPPTERYYSAWTIEGNKGEIIRQLAELDNHYGTDFKEILIYDEVYLTDDNVAILGANQNTVKITGSDMDYIRFRYVKEVPEPKQILGIVGTPNENHFNGTVTPQLFIKDWVVKKLEL